MTATIQPPAPKGSIPTASDLSKSRKKSFAFRKPPGLFSLAVLLALAVFLLGGAPDVRADRVPANCTGSGLGISLFTSIPDVHVGDRLFYSVNVFNGVLGSGRIACDATDITAFIVTPDGVTNNITLNRTTLHQGESDFYLDVVSYVVRAQDIQPDGTLLATARNVGNIHQNDTDSLGGGFQGVNTEVNLPCISISALCVGGVGENGLITFTGTVVNCGNNTLVNVTITNSVNGGQVQVTVVPTLARGASANFSGSWIPSNPCVSSTAILTARASDEFTSTPQLVVASTSIVCQNSITPGIRVTKVCPVGPVSPGQLLTFSGSVTNTGNVTLNNIVVVNNQPAANTQVFTVASLAPGAVANFTGSYLAPAACSVTDTLVATATSRCGTAVTSSATATCAILTTPQIAVTAACPVAPVVSGGSFSYSGTVRNTGDTPLVNVVVVADRPAANTTVFTAANLAPGQTATFTWSVNVPAGACAVTTVFTGSGKDSCTPTVVANSATTTCAVTTAPAIAVTLTCPAVNSSAGGSITYNGTVRNSGNVTLINVFVVNNQPTANTPVIGPLTILAGATVNFTTTFTAPIDACTVSSTVTGSGNDNCSGVLVANSATATCNLNTTPSIVVTQTCPVIPATPGALLTYSGTVRNSGNITLTNVVVLNNLSGATPIFTAATLAPGVTASFTGSYTAPAACTSTSTSTATGRSICGVAVTGTVSATCTILTAPAIVVTAVCPVGPIVSGGTFSYSGTVRNSGNTTLTGVVVVSDRPVANTTVFTVASLAPGASASFTSSVIVPANACTVTTTFTGSGKDICTPTVVANSATTTCTVTTAPAIVVTLACPAVSASTGGSITYTGTVRNSGNVILNNVTVVNNQTFPSTVFTVASLAPGVSANFTASFTAPADACVVSSTVTATGSDNCTGSPVSNTASATCTLVTTPLLALTQNCPVSPASPGGIVTFTGTVRNAGNITLNNVVVSSTLSALDTNVVSPSTVGLMGYWSLNEASGSVASDSSGFGNNGSIVNAAHVVGQSGNALSFNGVNTSVGIPNNAGLNITGVITMAAWVKPLSTVGKQNILSHGYTTAPDPDASVYLRVNDGRYEVGTWNNVVQPTAMAVIPSGDIGTFVHVAGVYDGSAWTIYRNGVALNTVAGIGAVPVNANWTIGARSGGTERFFNGVIDEVRLYNRALSGAEIQVLAGLVANPNPPPASTPVFTAVTLAPGAVANFSYNYAVPANSGCSITSTLIAGGGDICTGVRVAATTTTTCQLVTAPAIVVTAVCPVGPIVPGGTFSYSGTVRNSGNITLNNIIVVSDRPGANTTVFTAPSLTPGQVATWTSSVTVPANACTVTTTFSGSGTDCTPTTVTSTVATTCTVTTAPAIVVTLACPVVPSSTGGSITYTGTVRNSGNVTLNNVFVVNNQPAANTPVIGPITILAGATVNFTTAFTAPIDACTVSSTVVATGNDNCTGVLVSNSATAICTLVTTPGIVVTQTCPVVPTVPGALLTYTGTVRNSGNITLTNVVVLNNLSGATPIFTAATLAPGAVASFTGSYTAPAACTSTSTSTATGRSICGVAVTSTATATCTILTTPGIVVTQICPTTAVSPGGVLTYTGTVRNSGNITLTSIVVVNNMPAPNTVIFTLASLAPGATANFTGSYITPDDCCVVSSTVRATGVGCLGETVSDTATRTCTLLTLPALVVTKVCPVGVLRPGDLLTYTGTVRNSGSITLINVILVNNQPTNNSPVLGPITLAPGESASYTASYIVPPDFCGTDTVTASGVDICTFLTTVTSVTTTCPITTTPRIIVTKNCPVVPVPLGGLYTFTGSVSNAGNVTLVSVFVVDNQPAANTPVIGPITLAPGESVNFSGSFTAPVDCCEVINTVTARGQDRCTGSNVAATATTVCQLLSAPSIALVQACPPAPIPMGSVYNFSGYVTNTGNTVLTNVFVFGPQGTNTVLVGPIELAQGEIEFYSGSYTVPFDTCTVSVTTSGQSVCGGTLVANTTRCPVATTPLILVRVLCPVIPAVPSGLVTYSGSVSNAGNITLVNVVVVSDRPTPNTTVFTAPSLAPGVSASFTGTYSVATNVCSVTTTFSGTAANSCTLIPITNTVSTTCMVTTIPGITVTQNCPPGPVSPGATVVYGGSVSNSGNITLTNVFVFSSQPNNSLVIGPLTLAPGASAPFTGTFVATGGSGMTTNTTIVTNSVTTITTNTVTPTFGTINPVSSNLTDRFNVPAGLHGLMFADQDENWGATLFYATRHPATGADQFVTISTVTTPTNTLGAVTDRFALSSTNYDALTLAAPDVGYGVNNFYYLRHGSPGVTTFGVIKAAGASSSADLPVSPITGTNYNSLAFAAVDVGYGANLFYSLRETNGVTVFGTIAPSPGLVPLDRYAVGTNANFDSMVFVPGAVSTWGTGIFAYLRHTATGSIIGTIDPVTQVVTDRISLGTNLVTGLTFTATDVGYGPNLFYYLRPGQTIMTTNVVTTFTTNTVVTFTPTNTVTATGMDICLGRTVAAAASCVGPVTPTLPPPVVTPPPLSSPIQGSGAYSLNFQTAPGTLYMVQYKNELSDPTWTDLESIAGTGGVLTITDAGAGLQPMRFYRVIIIAQP